MLRSLTCALILLLTSAAAANGEDATSSGFAPGALGSIGIDVDGLMARAKRDASRLPQSLHPQAPADLGDLSPGLEDLQLQSMNDPRVRALLGLNDDEAGRAAQKPDYEATNVIVFASFAMPAPSLRQMMEDAERYGAQIVMRGFVENSVPKTEAALAAVFGDVAEAKGFAIDPTLFQRFNVEAVPVYVVLKDGIEPCESPGCGEDAPPAHDRVSGNIELRAALELVARAGGDAHATAKAILAAIPEMPAGSLPTRSTP